MRAYPKDTKILLNEKPYINDSKPQVDYGNYLLELDHDNYLTGAMNFTINDEKNFYIDDIVLLKKPEYKKFPKISDANIVALQNDYWLNSTASGTMLYHKEFLTGSLVSPKNFKNIGGDKFLSGTTLVNFDPINRTWSSASEHPILANFVKTCENPLYKNSLYYCSKDSLMTPSGRAFSGFLDSGKNFIKYENRILLGNIAENNFATFSLTGATFSGAELSNNFLELNGNWYNIDTKNYKNFSGTGIVFARMDGKIDEISPLDLSLDSVEKILETSDRNLFIGEKTGSGKILAITNKNLQKNSVKYIDFPDIELDDLRLYEKNRNYFIKTRNSLLFLYREANEIKWLVDGKILAIGDTFALYELEDGIWIADWKDENLKK